LPTLKMIALVNPLRPKKFACLIKATKVLFISAAVNIVGVNKTASTCFTEIGTVRFAFFSFCRIWLTWFFNYCRVKDWPRNVSIYQRTWSIIGTGGYIVNTWSLVAKLDETARSV
jgi:hypothetical protein